MFKEQKIIGKKSSGNRQSTSTVALSEAEKRKLEFEIEERERLDLQRMIRGEVTKTGGALVSKGAKDAVARCNDNFFKDENKEGKFFINFNFNILIYSGFSITDLNNSTEPGSLLQDASTKKLKIFRTFRGNDGSEWVKIFFNIFIF